MNGFTVHVGTHAQPCELIIYYTTNRKEKKSRVASETPFGMTGSWNFMYLILSEKNRTHKLFLISRHIKTFFF